MKPKILHLLDDTNIGGANRWVESISSSSLNRQFEFRSIRSPSLPQILKSRSADLIIYHNPDPWERARTLSLIKRYRIKTILQEHHYCEGFEQFNVKSRFGFRTSLRIGYQLVDRVVAVSQGQATWMRTYKLVCSRNLAPIPVEIQLESLLETPKKQLQSPFTFGAYGRFCKQKGFDTLIKAMQQSSTSNIQLYVGGYGEDESLLKTLASRQSNIKFWGSFSDVQGFLSACDAIVVPSRWEPRGLVCSEAKAAGKPIIASNIDGLTEQVDNCGILITPDDPNQLAVAMNTIAAASPTQLATWGRNARIAVEHAWRQHLADWETLLWTVLGVSR